jgi:hypothetical protein
MRILLVSLFLFISSITYSQDSKNYTCVSSGIFFNSPISDWKNTLGASIEYGRYLKSGISIGVNFGYWSLLKNYEYNGLKLTIPILSTNFYSLSISSGGSYFYHFKDIMLEYDFNANIIISKDKKTSLALSYCRQSGLGYNSAESFNFGINKDF